MFLNMFPINNRSYWTIKYVFNKMFVIIQAVKSMIFKAYVYFYLDKSTHEILNLLISDMSDTVYICHITSGFLHK